MSKIAVSIARTRHQMVLAEHQALAERGADLVELRLDWMQRTPDMGRLLSKRPTPVIVTCRRPADGGKWNASEEQRQMVLRSAIIAGADYVDIEADIALKIPRYGATKRVISHHDFEGTPQNLEEIHFRMRQLDPDVIKLVTTANSASDCVRMLELVRRASVPTVGFCMGEFGVFSRVLCGRFGSPWTYAAVSRDREIAPGMLTFAEMQHYRFKQITSQTKVFAVIGDPIGHSLSPLLHNAAMEAVGYDGVYVPIRIAKGQLGQILRDLAPLSIEGFSVTIPHKEGVLKQKAHPSEIVTAIGAANTCYLDGEGTWRLENTDYEAAIESLVAALPAGDTLEGRRVLMLGAGGAARAIGLGVLRKGAAVVITNRTAERARVLAEQLNCRHCTWENRGSENYDILINCTPVGMHPNVNESPFPQNWLRDHTIVFDTIYNPENTLLIKTAQDHNATTVTGIEMFVRQAARQFTLFTGKDAPLEVMRERMRRGISAAKL